MTAKLFDGANSEIMAVSKLERDGNNLVIRGKIYGSMPLTARITPQEIRNLLKLLTPRLLLFLVTLPFRRR